MTMLVEKPESVQQDIQFCTRGAKGELRIERAHAFDDHHHPISPLADLTGNCPVIDRFLQRRDPNTVLHLCDRCVSCGVALPVANRDGNRPDALRVETCSLGRKSRPDDSPRGRRTEHGANIIGRKGRHQNVERGMADRVVEWHLEKITRDALLLVG